MNSKSVRLLRKFSLIFIESLSGNAGEVVPRTLILLQSNQCTGKSAAGTWDARALPTRGSRSYYEYSMHM